MNRHQANQKEVLNEAPQEAGRKLGQGALGAAFRQGFAELANALKAFPDSLPIIEQPGQLNNVPPAGVSQQAGFTKPMAALYGQSDRQTGDKPLQDEMVTSFGKTVTESPGVVSQMREELKSLPTAPEMNQELSK